jgi:hypothetical protein
MGHFSQDNLGRLFNPDISRQVEENWYLEMEKGRFLRHNCVVQA